VLASAVLTEDIDGETAAPDQSAGAIHRDEDAEICKHFAADSVRSFYYGWSIGFMIIGFNILLRFAIIGLVVLVRDDSHSMKLTRTANGTFLATFFTSGILLTILSANLTEH
jgi:hypothetical protein